MTELHSATIGASHNPFVRNKLLRALSAADYLLLSPNLIAVDLPVRAQLQSRHQRVVAAHFIESGVASIVSAPPTEVELSIVGNEGMTGVSLALASADEAQCETYMQIAGSALQIVAADLQTAIDKSVSLHRVLLRYANASLRQSGENTLANAQGSLEQRLARWLLMVHDRLESDEISLTHEFLGVMLGVQRSATTVGLRTLERLGATAQRRGRIDIVDRSILEKLAEEIYVKPTKK